MEINNLEDFGKSMTPQEVASFLSVSPATICAVAEEFGGIRVGEEYVFFENVLLDKLKQKIFTDRECANVASPAANTVQDVQLEDRHGIFAG